MSGASLRERVLGGVAWSGAARIVRQLVQLAVTVALARLLMPEDFGLVGMVLVFVGLAEVVLDLGLGPALVQRQRLQPVHLHSAFWAVLAVGAVLGIVLAACGPLIAAFYGEPALVALCVALAPNFVLVGLGIVPRARLARAMDFPRLGLSEVVATVLGGATAVTLAAGGAGMWSLVALNLVGNGAGAVLCLAMARWRPRPVLSLGALRELAPFALNLTGSVSLNYLGRSVDDLVVGRVLGASALGIYGRAWSLMRLPVVQLTSVLSGVMFPALASIQGDRARVKRVYLRVLGIVALTGFPMVVGLAVVAEPFVLTLFGERWAAVAPVLQILSVAGLVAVVCNPTGWIFSALGRTDLALRWSAASTAVIAAGVLGGAWIGTLEAVAGGYSLANLVLLYPCLKLAGGLVDLGVAETARTVAGSLAAALLMGAAVWGLGEALPATLAPWLRLAVLVGAGVAVYGGCVHWLFPGPLLDLRASLAARVATG